MASFLAGGEDNVHGEKTKEKGAAECSAVEEAMMSSAHKINAVQAQNAPRT